MDVPYFTLATMIFGGIFNVILINRGTYYTHYIFYFLFAIPSVFTVEMSVISYKEKHIVPVMEFTITDKVTSTYCNTVRITTCRDIYSFILQTDSGYHFKQQFDVNTYNQFNKGDRISYKPKYYVYKEIKGK